MAEEGSFARRLELFGSKRKRLDREGQLQVLSDIEYLLDAISSRSLEIGNDYEVDVAQLVDIPSRHASEQKDIDRTELGTDSFD